MATVGGTLGLALGLLACGCVIVHEDVSGPHRHAHANAHHDASRPKAKHKKASKKSAKKKAHASSHPAASPQPSPTPASPTPASPTPASPTPASPPAEPAPGVSRGAGHVPAATGRLVVLVENGACDISVDGTSHGTRSPLSLAVVPGEHVVLCTSGGQTLREKVFVQGRGRPVTVQFDLAPAGGSRAPADARRR